MSKIHCLKTWPVYYQAIVEPDVLKRKTVEVRKDDRDYQVGDCLILQEYDPDKERTTGETTTRVVTHILRGQPFAPVGYVVMSLCTWSDAVQAGYNERYQSE